MYIPVFSQKDFFSFQEISKIRKENDTFVLIQNDFFFNLEKGGGKIYYQTDFKKLTSQSKSILDIMKYEFNNKVGPIITTF